MMMSATSDATMAPKAAPMTTPTARSMTLPRRANFLNSSSMSLPPCYRRVWTPSPPQHHTIGTSVRSVEATRTLLLSRNQVFHLLAVGVGRRIEDVKGHVGAAIHREGRRFERQVADQGMDEPLGPLSHRIDLLLSPD